MASTNVGNMSEYSIASHYEKRGHHQYYDHIDVTHYSGDDKMESKIGHLIKKKIRERPSFITSLRIESGKAKVEINKMLKLTIQLEFFKEPLEGKGKTGFYLCISKLKFLLFEQKLGLTSAHAYSISSKRE
jgi:hypothetical protein